MFYPKVASDNQEPRYKQFKPGETTSKAAIILWICVKKINLRNK